MKILRYISFVSICLLWFSGMNYAETKPEKVENIVKNPKLYNSENIETEGFIIHYVKGTQNTTSYYLLKGYYGDTLKVNTAEEEPEINQKYKVSGIVYVERIYKNGKIEYLPFLSEKYKECLNCPPPPKEIIIKDESLSQLTYIIGGAAGIIIIGLFAFIFIKGKKNTQLESWEDHTVTTDYSQVSDKTVAIPSYQPSHADSDFKTIKINTSPSKTMKLIPGRMEIISGEDKGKAFLIQGHPAKEGSITTIGREAVNGEMGQSHIQIDSKYQTVSRKQAELIYKDKKLFIKNMSETNSTAVDGRELLLGELAELLPDSIIKMGEIEFQYKI